MPPSNGRGGRNRKENPALENLRGACPPHKWKDLDKLYKQMKGDENKVMERIQLWWEEPVPTQEEQWEDVKASTLKKVKPPNGGGGRGRGSGGRGGGPGRGRSEGRGRGGREGRGRGDRESRGRGDASQSRDRKQPKQQQKDRKKEEGATPVVLPTGVPATSPAAEVPVPASVPVLKGAWGARAAAAAATVTPPASTPNTPAITPLVAPTASREVKSVPQPIVEDAPMPPEDNPLIVARNDPTPSGRSLNKETKQVAAAPSGNVWATRGSAHLIRAEKPKPPAPAPPTPIKDPEPLHVSRGTEPSLDGGLHTGAWGSAPETRADSEVPGSPPVVKSIPPPQEPTSATPVKVPVATPQSPPAPTNVLNMGHWETRESDGQNIDFTFGSFGADKDAGVQASPAPTKDVTAGSALSPARPPPGLSLTGMPPMPDGAVMVHELENKMENTKLDGKKNDGMQHSGLPNQASHMNGAAGPNPVLPSGITQQGYNQYGMAAAGVYQNYGAATGNAFVGMTPTGPVLAGGVVPQLPGKPEGGAGQPTVPGQQALYGNQGPTGPSSANATAGADGNNEATTTPGATGPPGMPSGIPYANPALHYQQQPQFYLGQHQGGIGYQYNYGQFGGVAQGGYGYQQVMGQNQGYGAPHYDDHSQQPNNHHSGGSGYQNKSGGGGGGYRGRNNHHGNSQYQNQYNPQQHGGYGGQPYGMGYHGGDHFNQQRAGYGGGMGDPYGGMPQNGGFSQDDDKNKKGGARGQFSQGPPPHHQQQQQQQQAPPQQQQLGGAGGQQSFGLQAQGSESTPSTGGTAAGWSGQTGGWGGGAGHNWQGN